MVKRPKSPDLAEEARYFTVCQPFPLGANWALDQDQQACATWIAECIGLEHLYAIHYKPSARGMILLEISKKFRDHERLLGEHRWSEMLTEPDNEQENRVSQIFHSFYAKGRDAQKDGWKNLVIKSTWFKNWSPGKGHFKQPYPQTYWCPVPVEDQTNKQLCRPLPGGRIVPPPRVEPPVVGSAMWAQKKNVGKLTVESLEMSWDEEVRSTEAINNESVHCVQPNAGPSTPVSPATTYPSTTSPYPPLAEIATSAPIKSRPTFKATPHGKNKKNNPVPFNEFIGGRGAKKSTPATWNKPPAISSASLPPAVKLLLNGPKLPDPAPRPANAWQKPIKLPVSRASVLTAKKETPSQDYSSWGQEPATSTIDQESIWNSPLPTKQKSKKGISQETTLEIPASSTSSTSLESTRSSSPQICNTPVISSPTLVRDVPYFRPSAGSEEEDSDCDDIYVPLLQMKVTDLNDLPPEEMEYAHASAWEREDAVEPESLASPGPGTERTYGNLWLSEEDPRAIPLPELICPIHYITCKKGICEEMAKLHRDKERKKKKEQWEKEGKKKNDKGKRKKDTLGTDNDNDENKTAEVDGDKFTIARSKTSRRGRFGKQKKGQDATEVNERSQTGRMRAFSPDLPSDGEAPNGASQTSQLPDQW